MNTTVKGFVAGAAVVLLGAVLFVAGSAYGQSRGPNGAFFGPGMMGNGNTAAQGYGPGMMGSYGDTSGSYGNMMGGGYGGMMGGGYGGMMGGLGTAAEPLSIDQATGAVNDYLDGLNNDNLILGEVMIFDNHAYAEVLDQETGKGAFELLVDPATLAVFPEPGPNMMWNTGYGAMGGFGSMMGGGMMGNFGYAPNGEVTVSPEEAVSVAQAYLDASLPGTTAEAPADPFPGYYTLHVERDGEIAGMLSVNAYTGQVFLHHWHGTFIEMAGASRG